MERMDSSGDDEGMYGETTATKRNETKRNETKRNETKRNETKRNETKRNETNQEDQCDEWPFIVVRTPMGLNPVIVGRTDI
jgi:hypothetical protein